MANSLYDVARQRFLEKQWDWLNDEFGGYLVDDQYVPNFSLDMDASHIPGVAIVATGINFVLSKTTTGGYAVGSGIAFEGVSHSRDIVAAVLFRQASPNDLVAYIDSGIDLPVYPQDSFDITVRPDQGTLRWFRL